MDWITPVIGPLTTAAPYAAAVVIAIGGAVSLIQAINRGDLYTRSQVEDLRTSYTRELGQIQDAANERVAQIEASAKAQIALIQESADREVARIEAHANERVNDWRSWGSRSADFAVTTAHGVERAVDVVTALTEEKSK